MIGPRRTGSGGSSLKRKLGRMKAIDTRHRKIRKHAGSTAERVLNNRKTDVWSIHPADKDANPAGSWPGQADTTRSHFPDGTAQHTEPVAYPARTQRWRLFSSVSFPSATPSYSNHSYILSWPSYQRSFRMTFFLNSCTLMHFLWWHSLLLNSFTRVLRIWENNRWIRLSDNPAFFPEMEVRGWGKGKGYVCLSSIKHLQEWTDFKLFVLILIRPKRNEWAALVYFYF